MNIPSNSSLNLYNNIYNQYNNSDTVKDNASNQAKSSVPGTKEYNDPQIRLAKRVGKIECQTCKNRKYQDVSNDAGVSFKAPGHISPDSAASVVMSHEQEHVKNESARATSENRIVVSQSVTLQTSICPECGRVYVSGGETRTATKADNSDNKKDYFKDSYQKSMDKFFGSKIDTRV